MSTKDIRREPLSWGTRVYFVYLAADGSQVGGPCWRMEYDTEAQRQEHARCKGVR